MLTLKKAGYQPPFRTPGYPFVPALFIASSVFLIGNALWDQSSRWATIGVFGAILAGIPVYYAVFKKRGDAAAA